MKPSERIDQIGVEGINQDYFDKNPQLRAENGQGYVWTTADEALMATRRIQAYLDEEHEKRERSGARLMGSLSAFVPPGAVQAIAESSSLTHGYGCHCAECIESRAAANHAFKDDCNCPESLALKRKLDAVKRIAESMENSSGSPHITADVEHHLRHWAGKLREAVG